MTLSSVIICLIDRENANFGKIYEFLVNPFTKLRQSCSDPHLPGSTPILGHIKDVRPEWVGFPGQKPTDGCKFLTKTLRMGHNFDII